ncbi:MAG TPA: ABC transporter permease [Candidatus Acidoferrales bacterium]|nr:ABC transporter permease [Candidatus Acidoferrales bacterium]
MSAVIQDLRYGLRMLRRTPGFTAIAVVALALGIGANTAIFSVAEAFLLKPLPFADLHRLVMVLEVVPHEATAINSVAPATYLDWKEQSRSFEQLGGFVWNEMNLTGNGVPEKIEGVNVSANFFGILRSRAAMGRTFREGEDQPGKDGEVVLSHGLWARQFGSDPNIIGKTVRMDNRNYEVVGVMPREFDFPKSAELWMPLAFTAADRTDRARRYVEPMARLKPGVTLDEAEAEMRGIEQRLAVQFPKTNRGWGVRVMPMRLYVIGNLTAQFTLLLLGAVGFVLLIVCANVANLQFARASGREREIAVRLALGAGRGGIVRLLLTESVLLALAGALPGLWLAGLAVDLIVKSMPADVAKYIGGWNQIQLDSGAVAFTVCVAVLAGVVAGLAPALRGSRPDLEESLKESGRGNSGGRATHRLRDGLVVVQVSLALVLMAGAGLMVKGFSSLLAVHQNLSPEQILTMHVNLPDTDRYKTPQQVAAFYDDALAQLSALPQVQSAAALTSPPYSNNYSARSLEIEGRVSAESEKPTALYEVVSPSFFPMMKVPLREGRLFDSRDTLEAPQAVIISANLARRYWPGASAIGRRIRFSLAREDDTWMTIVGVVGEVKYVWLHSGPEQEVYRPYAQAARHFSSFALRVAGDPMQLADTARRKIAAVDPDLALYDVKTLTQVMHESTIGLGYVAVMMAVTGMLGLILSAVGVYGVMAYAVGERTREFGIRLALGAVPGGILRLVFRRGARLTLAGLAIGIPGAIGLAHLLAGLLYGVKADDVPTFMGISLLLAGIAALACWLPARRAARTDPMVALRYE